MYTIVEDQIFNHPFSVSMIKTPRVARLRSLTMIHRAMGTINGRERRGWGDN